MFYTRIVRLKMNTVDAPGESKKHIIHKRRYENADNHSEK